MTIAKFVVDGDRRDLNGATSATVLIDRKLQLITVRPFRQHSSYTLPLADVAGFIVTKCIKAEVAEAKPARKFMAKRGTL
jgi:hypothetical protein